MEKIKWEGEKRKGKKLMAMGCVTFKPENYLTIFGSYGSFWPDGDQKMVQPASNSIFSAKMFNFFLPVFSFRVIDNLPVATTFVLDGKVRVN